MRGLGLLVAAVLIAGCGRSVPVPSPAQSGSACSPNVTTAVLPDWARAGFSDAEPIARHEIGRSGEIAAIIFGFPLVVPPPTTGDRNKILWVSRHATTAQTLDISAQRMDGTTAIGPPVQQIIDGGPGPSYVDLPQAGCWRLTLSWADRTDDLDLEYVVRSN